MEILTNLGKLQKLVWANPFRTKSEYASDIGVSKPTMTRLWKELREDHEAKLEHKELAPNKD